LNGFSSRDSLPRPASRKTRLSAKGDGEMYASLAGRESAKVSEIFFDRD
jgi:hypothetical protein